jgi:hypothetical protein
MLTFNIDIRTVWALCRKATSCTGNQWRVSDHIYTIRILRNPYGKYTDTLILRRLSTCVRNELYNAASRGCGVRDFRYCHCASYCCRRSKKWLTEDRELLWTVVAVLRTSRLFYHSPMWRSQWLRGIRRGSQAARLLVLWVRIPPGAWMSVSCECRVLSSGEVSAKGRSLDQKSYRVWGVWVWSQEPHRRGLGPVWLSSQENKIAHIVYLQLQ